MNKSAVAIAAVVVAVSAGTAFAKEDNGVVAKVNKKGDAITLSDGKVFGLPEGIEAESVKAGQHVRVVYTTNKAGKITVQSVTVVK
jgi:hypothetical protein